MQYIATAVILTSALAIALAGTPWIPEPRILEDGSLNATWLGQHKGFIANTLYNAPSINVLFYGDSITEAWLRNGMRTFQQYYAHLGTANYGIWSDRTEHLLFRIRNGEVTRSLNPKLCVLKIGTNNLQLNNDHSTALGVIANVQELRQRLPNTKILLLGVLPRNNGTTTSRTAVVNSIIRQLDDGKTIRFLDMRDHFYRGGDNFVTELYTSDLVHLSAAGYRKWAQVMGPLFSEMLFSN